VYGGSDLGNLGALTASATPSHGQSQSLSMRLPPLAMVVLTPED
jgi:1,4-alpha-glucan branching enzyme